MSTSDTGRSAPATSQGAPNAPGARIIGGDYHDNGPGPEVMTAETLTGSPVINPKGEELGKLTDVVLDVRGGRVAYAVLSCGGFLGIGDKLFAIPWSALALDADRKCFILDVDRASLESAPGFDKDHWPATASWQESSLQ